MKYFLRKTRLKFLLPVVQKYSYLRCEHSFCNIYNFANFTNSNESFYIDIFKSIYFWENVEKKIDFFNTI